MTDAGFDLLPGEHPIVPVMFGDAARAARIADAMLEHGVYVIAFSYPVVPQGKARIRVQLSAAHSPQDVETCVAAFTAAARGESAVTLRHDPVTPRRLHARNTGDRFRETGDCNLSPGAPRCAHTRD